MSDFGLIAIELVRSQSRYIVAERKLEAAQADLKAASDDLWQKIEALRDEGYSLADALAKRPHSPNCGVHSSLGICDCGKRNAAEQVSA
jgi:hypothetical protein